MARTLTDRISTQVQGFITLNAAAHGCVSPDQPGAFTHTETNRRYGVGLYHHPDGYAVVTADGLVGTYADHRDAAAVYRRTRQALGGRAAVKGDKARTRRRDLSRVRNLA